jgi:hypothetical protein
MKDFNKDFNKNFPSFEKNYLAQKQIKDSIEKQKKTIFIKNKFNKVYPNVNFDELISDEDAGKELGMIRSTDDGCIRYRHNKTKEVYVWNFIDKQWKSSVIDTIKQKKSMWDFIDKQWKM